MKTFVSVSIFCFYSIVLFSQIPDGYYDSAEGLTSDDLKTALHEIINDHDEYPYTSSSTDVWDILKESDKDPDNSSNVLLFYTGWSVDAAQEYNSGQGWSREHVWAKIHGDFGTSQGAGTDAHHLRPSDISVNSARNSRWFDNCDEEYYDDDIPTGNYTSSTTWVWEPRDEVKGDVARIMFYMATRYEGGSGEPDLELIDYLPEDNNSTDPLHAKLSALIDWHLHDPVDDFEMNRNNVIYGYQENRNPFIDHPEFACLIWECPNDLPIISNIVIDPEIPEENDEITIQATIIDNDGTISEAKLFWGNASGELNSEVVMENELDIYSAIIPAQNMVTTVYYKLSAIDNSSEITETEEYYFDVITTSPLIDQNANKILLYPNPVSNELIISSELFQNETCVIEIYNTQGQRVMSRTFSKMLKTDVSSFPKGLYFATIKVGGKFHSTEKLIIN